MTLGKEKKYKTVYEFYKKQTGTETEKRAKTLIKTGYSFVLIKKIVKQFETETT